MRAIDPIPHLRDDGGVDFKDEGCCMVCYRKDKQGQPGDACDFLSVVPSWPMDEFRCMAPDDDG